MRSRRDTINALIEATEYCDSEIVLNIDHIRDLFNDAVGQLKDVSKVVIDNRKLRTHIRQLKAENANLRKKEQPTLPTHYAGYDLQQLAFTAELLRKADVTPEDLKDAYQLAHKVHQLITEEQQAILDDTFRRATEQLSNQLNNETIN